MIVNEHTMALYCSNAWAGCKGAEPDVPCVREEFTAETKGAAWIEARRAGWHVVRDDVICPACAKAGHKPGAFKLGRVA
jgi:hypothetical protein